MVAAFCLLEYSWETSVLRQSQCGGKSSAFIKFLLILDVGHLEAADSCRENGRKLLCSSDKDNRVAVPSALITSTFNFVGKIVACND